MAFLFFTMIIEVVEAAFLDAFDRDELARITRFSLGISLDRITQSGDLEKTVHDLVGWAERADKLEQLVRVAKESTSNAKIAALPDEIVRSSSAVVKMSQGHWEVISVRLELLTKELQRLANIVEGPDGGNGVRFQSRENARKLAEIERIVLEIKRSQSNTPHVLEDPETKRYFYIGLVIMSIPVLIEIARFVFGVAQ